MAGSTTGPGAAWAGTCEVDPERTSRRSLFHNAAEYDWNDDAPPLTAHEDSIVYELHVRGFTCHPSSSVKHPGTFAGLVEKIPYLQWLGVTAVGALLAKLGLTPQKPLQRAYQRDPAAIEKWQREQFPAIAQQAKAAGGEVYFWDESGFRADAVHGKTWGRKGQTPVVERPGQRQSISAASAVNARGAFWYCTYEGGLNAELFVALLRKMMRHRSKPVHLVVDGLPAHKTALVNLPT